MPTAIIRTSNERGNVTTYSDDDRTVTAFTAPESATDVALSGLADFNAANRDRLQPAAMVAELVNFARRDVFPKFSVDRDEGAREGQAIAAAEARMREPLPSIRRDWFAADVERIRAMGHDAIAHLAAASLEELTAYLDAGQERTGLDDQAWQLAEHRFIAATFIERVGLQSGFEQRPTVDALFATGPDRSAAEAAADITLEAHNARKASLAMREGQLRSALALVAIALEMTPQAVLDEVLAA